jgi:hypothetical protein
MKTHSASLLPIGMAIVLLCFQDSVQAIPTPTSGTISFSGTASMDSSSFVTATKFTSFKSAFVGAPASLSGDYAGTAGAAVTVSPFTWDSPGAITPLIPVWKFVSGGLTYSFDLNSLHKDFASPDFLLLSGMGTAHITGLGSERLDKLDTFGLYNLRVQTLGVATFTFSSMAKATSISNQQSKPVPDTGETFILLGGCVSGICLLQRRVRKNLVRVGNLKPI